MNANQSQAKKLSELVRSAPIVFLFARNDKRSAFNEYFREQIANQYPGQAAKFEMDLLKVNYRNIDIARFVQHWMPAIGLPSSNKIFPGYYLFSHGVLVGYHSEIFDPNKQNTNLSGLSALVSLVAGAVVGIAEKNARKGVETFLDGINRIIGLNLYTHFHTILLTRNHNKGNGKAKTTNLKETELMKAYKLLGVPPTATDQEVKRAWRKLVSQHHPDKSAGSADTQERNRITTLINQAYNLIKEERAKRKKG